MFVHHPQASSGRETPSGLPRAERWAIPYVAIATASAAAQIAGISLPIHAGIITAAAFVCAVLAFAAGSLWRTYARDRADRWIAHRIGARPAPRVVAERSAELVSSPHRRDSAQALKRMLVNCEHPPQISSQVPLNRDAVYAHRADIGRLADVLGDASRAVTPRGVVLADELVTSPVSPAYGRGENQKRSLHEAVSQALFELERSGDT